MVRSGTNEAGRERVDESQSLVSARWWSDPPALRPSFRSASPFELLVLDDFLEPSFAEALLAEFPSIEEMPRSRDYIFGDKHELSSVDERGAGGRRFVSLVTSDEFARWLSAATGYEVFVDPTFFGGGFHQGGDGSYLDMHVDFNIHPEHETWLRTLNLLLYLNKDWQEEWGGQLLIKAAVDDEPRAIDPLFNRAVIMLTDDHTFHGYRKMSLPPGVSRKSIATYAYQTIRAGEVRQRTTGWTPEDAGVVKKVAARYYNGAVLMKNRLLGSRTAKNR
jgi:hypothetical protein